MYGFSGCFEASMGKVDGFLFITNIDQAIYTISIILFYFFI